MDTKDRIALACRIAYFEGLVEPQGNEFAGHISVRESNSILMPGHVHDYGRGLRDMTAADIISVDLNGEKIEGKFDPVSEVSIHTSVYKARSDVKSVVHLHPPTIVALGTTDQKLEPISIRSSFFAEGIPVLEKGPSLIDNEELSQDMVRLLGSHNAIIHKGHGIVTVGRNLEEACTLAMFLEGAAKERIVAKQYGGTIRPYWTEDAIKFAKSYPLNLHMEAWKYYERKWNTDATVKSKV